MATNGRLFIHKYQPTHLDDFGMDADILRFLKTMIAMDNLNLSFIGNIASGKTTLMNAIIREYYKDNDEKTYSDNVLFINSLKEQGINYYRTDVKTFCQTCSVIPHRKKIVVLDDLDLINEQSQQVFRNCIDKFSHNVHFISSCCNLQKVIESLQSRFTMIKIKPLSIENIVKLLSTIKTAEDIAIDDDAQEFIINVSNRTIKILINYMEKFKLMNEPITLQLAHALCSNISFCTFEDYTLNIKNRNINKAIEIIYDVFDKGYSVMDILDNYFVFVKNTDLLSEDEKYIVIPLLCKYITVFHDIHEDEIELALFTNNLISSLCVK
jgi:DNA polymerase III delta prime subunit